MMQLCIIIFDKCNHFQTCQLIFIQLDKFIVSLLVLLDEDDEILPHNRDKKLLALICMFFGVLKRYIQPIPSYP